MALSNDEYFPGEFGQRDRNWVDQKQVCLNGHVITAYAVSQPESRRDFCSACGAATIDACPACKKPLEGAHHIPGVIGFFAGEDVADKYCNGCGAALPWQQAALENLSDVIRESELSEAEARELESALPDIINDTPKTTSASLKVKRLAGKLGAATYEVAIKVISDLASETAKKTMGFPP